MVDTCAVVAPTGGGGEGKILTKPFDRFVGCPVNSPFPLTVGSMWTRGPTGNAPVGFAGSLPTGTVTGTGMPGVAAALGAFVLRRYDVYVEVIGGAGLRLAGVGIFS